RIFIDQLGDAKSAAICYQNAFLLNPQYRPNLEAARRLFASAGRHDRTLALHEREETLLDQDGERAESLRAQANVLRDLGRPDEAKKLVDVALRLSPDHPALLKAGAEAAQRDGDRALAARLLIRSAGATRDPVYKAQLLRRAVLLLDEVQSQAIAPPVDGAAPALEENRRDGALLALRCDLAEQQKSPDLADLLRQRAEGSIEPSERAHLKVRAALLLSEPMEQEQLLSEALADNPADAAVIAL